MDTKLLGSYLKDRRAKLNPSDFGIPAVRRRTPGLRREEVANRANVSATWYTWLEPEQRNVLRILFCDPQVREHRVNWLQDATFAVAAFRSEVMRAGAMESVKALVDELCQRSPETC